MSSSVVYGVDWLAIRPRLLDDREDIVFLHDQVFLVVDLHFGARVLTEEDLVAGLHVQRDLLPVLVHLPVAHRDDFAFLGLFLGGVRDDNPALLNFLLLLPLDDDAVVQRTNLHSRCASDRKTLDFGGPGRSASP